MKQREITTLFQNNSKPSTMPPICSPWVIPWLDGSGLRTTQKCAYSSLAKSKTAMEDRNSSSAWETRKPGRARVLVVRKSLSIFLDYQFYRKQLYEFSEHFYYKLFL